MNRTAIEWVRNPDGSRPGWSWNPLTGCLNGCEYCYARRLAHGRLKERYLANDNFSRVRLCPDGELLKGELDKALTDPFYPRFWEDRLEELRQRNRRLIERGLDKPRGIFVNDMGELFAPWIPLEWTEAIINEIDNKHDGFYLLTHQPQELIKWSPFPDNCYVGVTATNRIEFNMDASALAQIQAKIKYISFEPLLGRIQHTAIPYLEALFKEGWLNWVIIGAQTRPKKLPEWEWVREIIEAADKAGIPVFLKNNLGLPSCSDDGALPYYKRDPS